MSRRLPLLLLLTLASGLAIGAAGALVVAPRSATAVDPGITDRAALEALLGEPSIAPTGRTRSFELTVQETDLELLPGVVTSAVTFNGTVPGPAIRVTEGDTVEIRVSNQLSEPTSVHWHGLHVPNDQDGVAGVTQGSDRARRDLHLPLRRSSCRDLHVSRPRPSQPRADRPGPFCTIHHRPRRR